MRNVLILTAWTLLFLSAVSIGLSSGLRLYNTLHDTDQAEFYSFYDPDTNVTCLVVTERGMPTMACVSGKRTKEARREPTSI